MDKSGLYGEVKYPIAAYLRPAWHNGMKWSCNIADLVFSKEKTAIRLKGEQL